MGYQPKKSNALLWLIPLLGAVVLGALFLPGLLTKMYLDQESSKSKENIVGRESDATPPPGRSTDMYEGRGQQIGGSGARPQN